MTDPSETTLDAGLDAAVGAGPGAVSAAGPDPARAAAAASAPPRSARPSRVRAYLSAALAAATLCIGGASVADDPDPAVGVIDLAQRVVGGRPSSPGQWPSIVALIHSGTGTAISRQFCGGTVIADRWVLTAAHCLVKGDARTFAPESLRVIEGIVDLDFVPYDEERFVTNIFVHPGYDHERVDSHDDIALLELAYPLEAPPARLFDGDPRRLVGADASVVGWGATAAITAAVATYPDELRHATVPLVSREVCNGEESYAGVVGEGQLCAGYARGGVDSCYGDSGGPLFVRIRGGLELVGVTSFGNGCAEPGYYGIYTSVPAYLGWIRDYVVTPEPDDGNGLANGVDGADEPAGPPRIPRSPDGGGAPDDGPGTVVAGIGGGQGGDQVGDQGGSSGSTGSGGGAAPWLPFAMLVAAAWRRVSRWRYRRAARPGHASS